MPLYRRGGLTWPLRAPATDSDAAPNYSFAAATGVGMREQAGELRLLAGGSVIGLRLATNGRILAGVDNGGSPFSSPGVSFFNNTAMGMARSGNSLVLTGASSIVFGLAASIVSMSGAQFGPSAGILVDLIGNGGDKWNRLAARIFGSAWDEHDLTAGASTITDKRGSVLVVGDGATGDALTMPPNPVDGDWVVIRESGRAADALIAPNVGQNILPCGTGELPLPPWTDVVPAGEGHCYVWHENDALWYHVLSC